MTGWCQGGPWMMLKRSRRRLLSAVLGALAFASTARAPPAVAATDSPGLPPPVSRTGLLGKAWLADKDENSLYSLTKWAGVHDVWSRSDAAGRKITGQGVGVALID